MLHPLRTRLHTSLLTGIFGLILSGLVYYYLKVFLLDSLIPFYQIIIMISLASAIIGFLSGKALFAPISGLKAFTGGLMLVFLILPVVDFGIFLHVKSQPVKIGTLHQFMSDNINIYFLLLTYSIVFIGSWLSIIAGIINFLLYSFRNT